MNEQCFFNTKTVTVTNTLNLRRDLYVLFFCFKQNIKYLNFPCEFGIAINMI